MAFNLNLIASAPETGVWQQHIYRTTADSLLTVTSSTATDYFLTYTKIDAGDSIYVEASDGAGWYRVVSKTSTAVTLNRVGGAVPLLNTADAAQKIHIYGSTANTLKTIASATATTFFATNGAEMRVGDTVLARGSDAMGLFRVTSSNASTTPTLAPANYVAAAPAETTSANVTPYGLFLSTVSSASTTTYTLDMPWGAGQMKAIAHIGGATALTIVMASTAAGSINSTGVQILFNAANQFATLVGASTARWVLTGLAQQSATAIIGPVVS